MKLLRRRRITPPWAYGVLLTWTFSGCSAGTEPQKAPSDAGLGDDGQKDKTMYTMEPSKEYTALTVPQLRHVAAFVDFAITNSDVSPPLNVVACSQESNGSEFRVTLRQESGTDAARDCGPKSSAETYIHIALSEKSPPVGSSFKFDGVKWRIHIGPNHLLSEESDRRIQALPSNLAAMTNEFYRLERSYSKRIKEAVRERELVQPDR